MTPPNLASAAHVLHLFSFLLPGDALMLRHWLQHYYSLGVRANHTSVAIRLDKGIDQSADLAKTLAVLKSFGVLQTSVRLLTSPPSDDLKISAINSAMDSVPKDDFFIYADVDEHFDYPCHINLGNIHKYKCMVGKMIDQVASNGNMSIARESPWLVDQFPMQCNVRTHAMGPRLNLYKTIITTVGGGIYPRRRFRSTHTPNGSCTATGAVRHYSMTGQQMANNAERKSIVPRNSFTVSTAAEGRKSTFSVAVNYANATCGMTDQRTGICLDYRNLHTFMEKQVQRFTKNGDAILPSALCPRNLSYDVRNSSSWNELIAIMNANMARARLERMRALHNASMEKVRGKNASRTWTRLGGARNLSAAPRASGRAKSSTSEERQRKSSNIE